jgi:ribA/ribD-fused uncharacterized protein
MKEITRFDGDFRFLSNFYPSQVRVKGLVFPTAEHAYQAMKCRTDDERRAFTALDSPGAAKRRGRTVDLRLDWEQVKKRVMLAVVAAKFTQNEALCLLLVETGTAHLEEGNTWHDNFWGACGCPECEGKGLNYLGEILMAVRLVVRPD